MEKEIFMLGLFSGIGIGVIIIAISLFIFGYYSALFFGFALGPGVFSIYFLSEKSKNLKLASNQKKVSHKVIGKLDV